MFEDFEKVLEIPARFVDITYQRSHTTVISTKDGVAKDISTGVVSGSGIRVLENVWGFASSNESSDLAESAQRAYSAAKRGKTKIPFSPGQGVEDSYSSKVKIDPGGVSLEDKVDLGRRAFDSIGEINEVVSSSFNYIDSTTEGLYMSSEGARLEWKTTRIAFFASIFTKENGKLQFGSERVGSSSGFEFLKDPEAISLKAAEKALRLLRAKAAPSGTFRVILDPQLTGVFIHEALGHAVEADHVIQGESILGGQIENTIASSLVSVYDDPTMEGSFGYYLYDSEGTRAGKTQLIDRGVLKGYLHSRETASRMGLTNTGNARAQGFDFIPIVRMSNTILEPGSYSLEEMLEGVDYGVYLLGSRGGQVDPAKGVFQFSAEEGYLIEKGEAKIPLRDVALSGETLKILKAVDAVGRDFGVHVGFCGKDGQSVPVGDGGAPIRTMASVGGTS